MSSAPARGAWQYPVVATIVLILSTFGFSSKRDSLTTVLGEVLTFAFLFGYLAYRRSIERRPWRELGFVKPAWDDLWTGLAGGAAMLAFGMLYSRLTNHTGTEMNLRLAAVTGSYAAAALAARTAMQTLGEELIFRSYMIPRLEETRGLKAAVAISVVAFGLLHYTDAIPTAVDGLILSAVFLRRRSIWAAWLAHASINMTILLSARSMLGG